MTRKTLRAIDLCAGAGGWACAARGLPVDIVAAIDLWEPACRTYKHNHPPTAVVCGDLRDDRVRRQVLSLHTTYRFDCVLGAIPCEWLSIRRIKAHNPVTDEELARERSTLRSVLQLVDEIGPAYWCLEDVKGLAKELPPDVPWLELDSGRFSAQRRKRIYVGRFPAPILNGSDLKLRDALRPGPYRIGRRAADNQIVSSRQFCPGKTLAMSAEAKSLTVCSWSSRRDAEVVILDPTIPGGRRQIEWQEGAALQGFPADYIFYGSPTDVWKMIGQAIQIHTGRAILKAIARDAGLVTPEGRSP